MLTIDKTRSEFLYQQVIDLICDNLESGALRPGDRLPSLRQMSQTAGVSIPTVRQAYIELEKQRRDAKLAAVAGDLQKLQEKHEN